MCYFENLNVLFRKPGCAAAAASSSLGVASDLPLIPCTYCKATMREITYKKEKFYRCMDVDKVVIFFSFCSVGL
jgi:hypothetical protein